MVKGFPWRGTTTQTNKNVIYIVETQNERASRSALGTMLPTVDEYSSAKTVLDPGADAVETEKYEGAPKGCSRHKGAWYFNTHASGVLDGISEPVCKTVAGK